LACDDKFNLKKQLKDRMQTLEKRKQAENLRVGDLQDEAEMVAYVKGRAVSSSRRAKRTLEQESRNL